MIEVKATNVTDADRGFIPLAKPQRVSEQYWPPGTQPWVSIFSVTYQHGSFIAKSIESFLMQETTFPVEILIHDDASTDGTADIVRAYAEKFPNLIRTILQTENQYSKGRKAFRPMLKAARGRFIAVCEGDDYWTHPRKLERQHAAFEKYPEAVLCGHDVEVIRGDTHEGIIGIRRAKRRGHRLVTLSPSEVTATAPDSEQFEIDYIEQSEAMLKKLPQTLSVLFRNVPFNLGPGHNNLVVGDCYFMSQLCVHGGIAYLPEPMGAYNMHPGGVYSSTSVVTRVKNLLACYQVLLKDISPRWAPQIGVCTAQLSLDAIRQALMVREPVAAMQFVAIYFTTVIGPVRGLKDGLKRVPDVLWALLRIGFIPIGYVLGFLPRKFRNRSKGGRK